jgi:hypothetical protein
VTDSDAALSQALRDVWLRHRDTIVADLQEMLQDIETWNAGVEIPALADRIRIRSHRLLGNLTVVGRNEGADDLRTIELLALERTSAYAKEVVDRVHDLLERLRNAD